MVGMFFHTRVSFYIMMIIILAVDTVVTILKNIDAKLFTHYTHPTAAVNNG